MGCALRIVAGIAIPVVTALFVAWTLQPPYDGGPRGSANLGYYLILVIAAFVGAFLLRSCLAVIVMPLAIFIPGLIYRAASCPDCSSWTYDTTLGGAIIMAVFFVAPIVIASVVGTMVGQGLKS